MKKEYEKPNLEVIKMKVVDILADFDPNMSNSLEDEFED